MLFVKHFETMVEHSPYQCVAVERRGARGNKKRTLLNGMLVENVAVYLWQSGAVYPNDVEFGTVAEGTGINHLNAGWQGELGKRLATYEGLVADVGKPIVHDYLGNVPAIGKRLTGNSFYQIATPVGTDNLFRYDYGACSSCVDSRQTIAVAAQTYVTVRFLRSHSPYIV